MIKSEDLTIVTTEQIEDEKVSWSGNMPHDNDLIHEVATVTERSTMNVSKILT